MRASNRRHRSSRPTNPAGPGWRKLERENERLTRDNERLRQELIEKERRLTEAEKEIAEAEKQIAELERKLALRQQNSTTSSKPPSSDGLAGEQRERGSKRKMSRRKPGGQPGHCGHWRGMAPASDVSSVVDVFPARCRHCDSRLPEDGRNVFTQGEPRRHQVTELPRIEAHITEYRCQRRSVPRMRQHDTGGAAG